MVAMIVTAATVQEVNTDDRICAWPLLRPILTLNPDLRAYAADELLLGSARDHKTLVCVSNTLLHLRSFKGWRGHLQERGKSQRRYGCYVYGPTSCIYTSYRSMFSYQIQSWAWLLRDADVIVFQALVQSGQQSGEVVKENI